MLMGFLAVVILGVVLLLLPPVWSRVSFHAQEIYTEIKYKLFPPQDIVFVPESTPSITGTPISSALTSSIPSTPLPSTAEPTEAPTSTNTPIPLPATALLNGINTELQEWNNCGPATLSMYLSYWKWSGNQDNIAPIVKPNSNDKNVMPYELQDFVQQNTDFQAVVRAGGDMQTLKALVADGIPVMVEKGFYIPTTSTQLEGWMGHYELVMGYDDNQQVFLTHDSYLPLVMNTAEGKTLNFKYDASIKAFEIPYDDFYQNWRAFNFVFLVVYPQDKTNDVTNLLGPLWDEQNAFQIAHDRALAETTSLTDPSDQFFAWFNLGSSLVDLQNYTDAATAYDKAFALQPSITGDHRPWRMLWYQTGPYFAYYYAKRYSDVINLATTTLNAMSDPILEESFYWRALAELASGDEVSGIADLRQSLKVHPDFGPTLSEFQSLGVNP